MPRNKKPSDDDNLEFPLDTPADESSNEPALGGDASEDSGTELETDTTEAEDVFEQKPVSGHVDDMFSEW
ncbi:MAG: hypothetical protein ACI9JZ_001938, partial [Lentimonas sp.]